MSMMRKSAFVMLQWMTAAGAPFDSPDCALAQDAPFDSAIGGGTTVTGQAEGLP
jgi:hypothetical protein